MRRVAEPSSFEIPEAPSTTPGWYPNPDGTVTYRWWDGSRWTEAVSAAGGSRQPPTADVPQPAAPPVLPPTPPGPRRRWLWIGLGAGGSVILILVALIVAGMLIEATPRTLLSSNFNRAKGPFVAESDPEVSLQYVDGGHQTLLKADAPPQTVRHVFSDATVRSLRIEIDATVRSGGGDYAYAVGVWNGPTADYLLAASPTNGIALLKEANAAATGEKAVLAEHGLAVGSQAHFVLDVRGGGNAPTRISGTVNGERLEATDTNGYDSFNAVGIWIASSGEPLDILWDNITVTRLDN